MWIGHPMDTVKVIIRRSIFVRCNIIARRKRFEIRDMVFTLLIFIRLWRVYVQVLLQTQRVLTPYHGVMDAFRHVRNKGWVG